jgi:integrase
MRAEYGTPEFDQEYRAAVEGRKPEGGRQRAAAGSLAWLYDRYREVGDWKSLKPATRRQRENIFVHVMKSAGAHPCTAIRRSDVIDGRDARSSTPSQARNFLDAMRGLFRWALDADHVKVDPTVGVKNPKRPKGGGFPVWTEEEVERYEARWPVGTKERVWLDVLLYMGWRRGDAVLIGKQHVRDGVATLRTEKGHGDVTVSIPILPILAATLAAGPTGDLAFVCGATGKPITKETFGNYFREAANAAGVSKSAHGLRKIGATRAAENGMTVAELEAIFGWSGGQMAALYTRGADRKRLAKGAINKLVRTPDEHSMLPPPLKVVAPAPKE